MSEYQDKIDQLKKQNDTLRLIISEADLVEELLGSAAWGVIRKTLDAQIEAYKSEVYSKAGENDKNLPNAVGKMEATENLKTLVERDFIVSRGNAQAQLAQNLLEIKQLEEIDKPTEDSGQIPPYGSESPGLTS